MGLGINPTRILIDDCLVVLVPRLVPCTDREHTERNNAGLWPKGMSSAYIRVKKVRGQVPGTTRNGARTNSAINNTQTSDYVRSLEKVARRYNGIKRQGR